MGIILILLAIILVGAYLFLGKQEEFQRSGRITNRVKIEVPPPTLNDFIESPETPIAGVEKPKSIMISPERAEKSFKEEERLVDDNDNDKEKKEQMLTQKVVEKPKAPKIVTKTPPVSGRTTIKNWQEAY